MSTTITIKNLCKHYKPFMGGASGVTKAVDDLTLTIPSGSLFFLLGPSGCGKTTLLRMIAGFIEPTSGSILFDSKDVSRLPPNKRNTGMVFQSYALWPHMSVAQNVAFGLGVRKVPRAERDQRVMEALAAVHMDQYAQRKPNQLSGGQQQRVALARALVVRPSVLLLDEPLSNLDAKLRLEMRGEIKRICKTTGITTVYVTHDQKEALSMADQMAVLNMGVIAEIGAPRDLYTRPGSKFVAEFIGETNFIQATIKSIESDRVTLQTASGELVSTVPARDSLNVGSSITLSIRPETIQLLPQHSGPSSQASSSPHCRLTATVIDSIYLGEMSQHIVELPGKVKIKLFDLHPGNRPTPSPGSTVEIAIDPRDIVILTQ